MLSFWEKESFIKYDIIIVGGGITGLSSAIEIKELKPNLSIAVFEAGLLPSGASTKNAGFACFGSLSELKSDEKELGTDKMLELVENRWHGLKLLRKRLGDDNIDFQQLGGYELLFESKSNKADIGEMNDNLHSIFKANVYTDVNSSICKFGFNENNVKGMLFNPFEGQIHTGKMMKALIQKASEIGVILFNNAKVDEITEEGVLIKDVHFKSEQTIVCTNAFTKELLPDVDLMPGRGQVLITHPIENLKIKGTFHYDEGYYYFRNFENRVLIGGGRNKDFATETTTEIGLNSKIQDHLVEQLTTIILPNTPFQIDQRWAGIMAFSNDKFPIIKRINNRTVIAVKLGGIGVALGSMAGKQAAELTIK